MSFVVALTGHRKEKIIHREDVLHDFVREEFERFRPALVICGMANGFDLIGGIAALDAGIPVLAAKPWTTHRPRVSDVDAYARIIEEAEEVYPVTESDGYPGAWVYQVRNEWMVDECDRVYAYWNGSPGGTCNCIEYATGTGRYGKKTKVKKPVRNIFEQIRT